ncbi:MAG TPA: BamA/TamA family outer membrane protein [Chitinophagaceae bacterium]|nr:BamA/TamA family outer membrane protein [Chitinophagaceae bacterium]
MLYRNKIVAACLLTILLSPAAFSQEQAGAREKHQLLALPVISRSIETDWGFGGAASYTFHLSGRDSFTRTSNMQAVSYYTLKRQFLAALDGTIYFPKEKYILSSHLSYSYYPDQFWGIGRKTPERGKEPYSFRQCYVYLHGQRLIAHQVFLGLIYSYQNLIGLRYRPGGLFDQQQVTGRTPYHVSGLGFSLSYDRRNNTFAPDHGELLLVSFSHYDKLLASDFRYANLILDFRKYWPVFRRQVLAAQAYGFFNSGLVPFMSLASLGGSETMRGYYDGRFRDKNLIVLQTEYRFPVWWRFGAVLFAGAGDVAHRLDNFNLLNLKYSGGAGIRFAVRPREKMNIRLDYGIGQGRQNGFYLQFGEAF